MAAAVVLLAEKLPGYGFSVSGPLSHTQRGYYARVFTSYQIAGTHEWDHDGRHRGDLSTPVQYVATPAIALVLAGPAGDQGQR